MTKPLAIVGYIGVTTNLTRASSLVGMELAAMASLLEDAGYEVKVSGKEFETKRAKKEPKTGLECWDGTGTPEIIWCHSGTPNFMGGPKPAHEEQIGVLADAIEKGGDNVKIWRLLVDNNETMRHHSINGLNRKQFPSFIRCLQGFNQVIDAGNWAEVGWADCRTPGSDIPFMECGGWTTRQLLLNKKLLGGSQEKEFDFAYVGTSRANPKKRDARALPMAGFLDHEPSFYTGSFFRKRKAYAGAWEGMAKSKAHLITREKTMEHLPLHRYMQALILDAIPMVLGEPEEVGFIHDPYLQSKLRVKNYEEGLSLLEEYDELLPKLKAELEYWIDFDLAAWDRFTKNYLG